MNKHKAVVLILLGGYLLLLLFFTLFSRDMMEHYIPCVAYTEIQGAYLDGIYYEKTVPLAAIEWRTEGECVYELIERDTPLGTRIYLHRVNISVLETGSDRTFAAISAPVPSGTRVAIPTDAGLQDKQIVQIKDEENE